MPGKTNYFNNLQSLKKWSEQAKENFESNLREDIIAIVNKHKQQNTLISIVEYQNIVSSHGLNSYERRVIFDLLDIHALVYVIDIYLKNSSFRDLGRFEIPESYDSSLARLLYPLLLKRTIELYKFTFGSDITPEFMKPKTDGDLI